MPDGKGRIPVFDLLPQYEEAREEIDEALLGVAGGGAYILGPEVKAFEGEFAEYVDTGHAVGVGSGTEALYLAVRALGIGPGDEVITTAFTFIATADAVTLAGATPVFADIDPDTYNIDPRSVADRITERTRAVIAVHLYGLPADMDALGEVCGSRGIPVIEDCAQAHGALYRGRRVGSIGKVSTFSFFPTKPLGGLGDGGMVLTDDDALADEVRMLRAHGSRVKYLSEAVGVNSRLDELQAAVLRVKLRRLDRWNTARRAVAKAYSERLSGVVTPRVPEGLEHVFHLYTVRAPDRERLRGALEKSGISSNVYYPVPMHLQPCFSHLGYGEGDLPECERAAAETLSIPVYYGMTEADVQRVCAAAEGAPG